MASLDVTNIISGSGEGFPLTVQEMRLGFSQTIHLLFLPRNPGRPRRRTAWNPSREADTPGELYCRTLGSEDEQPRAPPPDWSHMRGIISSDGESN